MDCWKFARAWALLLWIGGLSGLQAQPVFEPGLMVLREPRGVIYVENQETGERTFLTEDYALRGPHTIVTGLTGSVEVWLTNGNFFRVGRDSQVRVVEYSRARFNAIGLTTDPSVGEPADSRLVLNFAYGQLIIQVRDMRPESYFELMTPFGRIDSPGSTLMLEMPRPRHDESVTLTLANLRGSYRINQPEEYSLSAEQPQVLLLDGRYDFATNQIEGATEQIPEVLDEFWLERFEVYLPESPWPKDVIRYIAHEQDRMVGEIE